MSVAIMSHANNYASDPLEKSLQSARLHPLSSWSFCPLLIEVFMLQSNYDESNSKKKNGVIMLLFLYFGLFALS